MSQAERSKAENIDLIARRSQLAGELRTQHETVTTMETKEASYRADLAAVNAMEESQEALDGDLIDSEHARRAISELQEAASVAEQASDEARRQLSEVRRELDPLESGSTLATAADIEAVCAHLNESGVGALTAWSWLTQRGDVAEPTRSSPPIPRSQTAWCSLTPGGSMRPWQRFNLWARPPHGCVGKRH